MDSVSILLKTQFTMSLSSNFFKCIESVSSIYMILRTGEVPWAGHSHGLRPHGKTPQDCIPSSLGCPRPETCGTDWKGPGTQCYRDRL